MVWAILLIFKTLRIGVIIQRISWAGNGVSTFLYLHQLPMIDLTLPKKTLGWKTKGNETKWKYTRKWKKEKIRVSIEGKGNGEDRGILHPTGSPIRHQCKVNLNWMNPLRIFPIQLSVLNNCPAKQTSNAKASQNNCCHSYLNANMGHHRYRFQEI